MTKRIHVVYLQMHEKYFTGKDRLSKAKKFVKELDKKNTVEEVTAFEIEDKDTTIGYYELTDNSWKFEDMDG